MNDSRNSCEFDTFNRPCCNSTLILTSSKGENPCTIKVAYYVI